MKSAKILLIILLFYFFVLIQTTFLVHFDIPFISINFVLMAVVIFNLFESRKKFYGLFAAGAGGFFSDIFSSSFIGFNILILLATAVFIKFILKNYVQIPFMDKD